jgi:hypothetical protein
MKDKIKNKESYIQGCEDTLDHIRKNLNGGALRQFDIASFQFIQMLEFVKKGKSILYNSLKKE